MTGKQALLPVVALAAFVAGFAAATVVQVVDADEMRHSMADECEVKLRRVREEAADKQRVMRSFAESNLRHARQAARRLLQDLAQRDMEIKRLKQIAQK
jgi:hypothetical protein